MNILYLCEEYPPGKNGGIGTMVRVLARELVKQGHQVYVVGLYPYGYGQANYEEDNGVKVWRLRYRADIGLIKNNYSAMDNLLWKSLKYSSLLHWDTKRSVKSLFSFVNKLVEKYQVDIIDMPDWNTFLHNSLSIVQIPFFKVPLTVKFHGSHSYCLREMSIPYDNRIFNAEQALINRADALSAVSLYTATQTKKLFTVSKAITVLHNTVNIPLPLNRQAVEGKLIFTGALLEKKGVHSLLKAWNRVNSQWPKATLHLYGKGPVTDLKKLIEKHAQGTVFFHGHVAQEILFEELASATAAVFPSYSETFSLAPLEAMAAGCAVIYTSRSSGPELVTDMENGLLVDPDDIDGIAAAIMLLLKDEVLRNKIAGAGKRMVIEKYNISISAEEHIRFYTKAIDEFNSGHNRTI